MAPPTWVAGQVLTASDVNSWFVPLAAVKPSDTSRASTTTLAADPDLTLAVAANATYEVKFFLFYDGNTRGSGDIKYQFTGPASASFSYTAVFLDIATGGLQGGFYYTLSTVNSSCTVGAGTVRSTNGNGVLTTSSTAGSFTLQWAQNTSSATATILHAGSYAVLQRVG